MKATFGLGLAATLTAVLAGIGSSADNPAVQSRSVNNLTAQVRLIYAVPDKPIVIADFSTSDPRHHSVVCLSAHRDLKYVLKDSSGNIVPQNPDAWKYGDSARGSNFGPIPNLCASEVSKTEVRASLVDFYSNLAPGAYTLIITLAPRGSSEHTAFSPITINITR